jgi:nucleoside-diphosphate-sugar epimerase
MRIFLAGATGVIGRRAVRLLVEVATRSLPSPGGRAAPGRCAPWAPSRGGHAYDAAVLAKAVQDAAPDAIIHQLTDLRTGDLQANAALRRFGTRNLVDAALATGVPRVVAQSIAWAYEGGDDPAGEQISLDLGAPEPRQTTVRGIVDLEEAVHQAPEWVVLRYGLLYGPDTWFAPAACVARTPVLDGWLPVLTSAASCTWTTRRRLPWRLWRGRAARSTSAMTNPRPARVGVRLLPRGGRATTARSHEPA